MLDSNDRDVLMKVKYRDLKHLERVGIERDGWYVEVEGRTEMVLRRVKRMVE